MYFLTAKERKALSGRHYTILNTYYTTSDKVKNTFEGTLLIEIEDGLYINYNTPYSSMEELRIVVPYPAINAIINTGIILLCDETSIRSMTSTIFSMYEGIVRMSKVELAGLLLEEV